MRKKCFSVFLLLAILIPFSGYSQGRQVTGRVTTSNGEPVPAASVIIKGTNSGVTADENGRFSITVAGSPTLVISSTGYESRELKIGTSNSYDVSLANASSMNEVIVTALGIRREKKALGYSAQEIKADELLESRQPNIVNALQGRTTGVQINATGGAPGQGARIIIRGITSLDPSRQFQPLFVVDGLPIDNSTDEGGSGTLRGLSNRAVDINPDDIASITVLKGGAATALYGLRAASGVVLINTKTGQPGKLRVGVSSTMGVEEVNKYPETQTKYTQGYLNTTLARPEYDKASFWPSWGPTIQQAKLIDPTHPDQIFNNYQRGYQRGSFFRNSLTMSGGSEQAVVSGSVSHLKHNGVMPFSDFRSLSMRVNGEFRFTENIKAGININYINSGGDRKNADRYNEQLSYWSPRWDVLDYIRPDGTMKYYGLENDNPVYIAYTNRYKDNVNRAIVNGYFNWSPVKWLEFSYRAGTDVYSDDRTHTAPGPLGTVGEFHPVGDNDFGFIEEYRGNKRIINSTAILNFKADITPNLNSSFKIGHDLYEDKTTVVYAYGDTLVVPTFFNMKNAKRITGENGRRDYRIIGLFADWSLNWKDYLYLTLTGRNDWSSTLPAGHRSFFYPSASVSYIFSENLNLPAWFTFGKLRASYAIIGKDALPYSLGSGYDIGTPLSNNVLPFTLANRTGNPNLKPEFSTSGEIGTELFFYGNRLGVDFTYYNTKSEDLIIPVNIPVSTGFEAVTVNAGAIRNRGIELGIFGVPVKTNDLMWETRVNFSRNRNKVLDIYPGLTEIIAGSQFGYLSSTVTQKYIPGFPVGALFGRSWARYNGGVADDPLLIDKSKPILIGANGFPVIDTRQKYLANTQPKWIGSFYNSVRFKQFGLSFLFDAQQGLYRYNQMSNFMSAFGIAKYTENREQTIVFEGVTADGKPNTKPVYLGMGKGPDGVDYGVGFYRNYHRGVSENFIEDASWIRLRNVTLSYRFPSEIVSRSKFISDVNLSLTANNLWLHTDYSTFDPEASSNSSGNVVDGFSGFTYPATRSFLFTLSLTL